MSIRLKGIELDGINAAIKSGDIDRVHGEIQKSVSTKILGAGAADTCKSQMPENDTSGKSALVKCVTMKDTTAIARDAALEAVADLELSGNIPLTAQETAAMVDAMTTFIQQRLWETGWWKKQCRTGAA